LIDASGKILWKAEGVASNNSIADVKKIISTK